MKLTGGLSKKINQWRISNQEKINNQYKINKKRLARE